MVIKKIRALYFSATGTTEKIVTALAEKLAAQMGAELDIFDFTSRLSREQEQCFCRDELLMIGVPVYAGRVPNVLLPYLNEKLCGHGGPAVAVAVYGNRAFDDSLVELRDILERTGMHTVAAGAFVGEHSFSRVMGAGRPDAEDMELLNRFAEQIDEKLRTMVELSTMPLRVRGEKPGAYYIPRDREGKPVNILKVKPVTDLKKCTGCGLCAQLCPMGSISAENVSKVDGICIKCCACIKKCPVDAKVFDDERYIYHKRELEETFTARMEPEWFL